MTAALTPDWTVFKQIFANHWDGFKRVYPRYDQHYYDGLVHKMLDLLPLALAKARVEEEHTCAPNGAGKERR